MDINLNALESLSELYQGRLKTLYSTESEIARQIAEADLIIGATLIPVAATPQLLKKEHSEIDEGGYSFGRRSDRPRRCV